jgi:glyoxylase-like metal-dependent hydrolase (beta-lactamase superfamily II)
MSKAKRNLAAVLTVVLIILAVSLRKTWLPVSSPQGQSQNNSASKQVTAGPARDTVAPGVHFLNNLGPAAAYVIETSDGLVLVDSGLESDGAAITRDFRYRKLDLARLRAILLTHAHGDHSLGARFLRSTTGAKVYAGRDDSAVLRAGQPRQAFFSAFDMRESEPHSTEIDVELKGGEDITIGDARFQVIATPGHTPGSTCYFLERGSTRILFSGDVIMTVAKDASPDIKELGTYTAYLAPVYRGDAESFLATIRELKKLSVPDLILPGHPQADSPHFRMPQAHWDAMLDKGARDMTTLLVRYQADGRNFLDGTPKQLLTDLFYLGDVQERSVYCLQSKSGTYLWNAPGGPDLVEFLDSKFRALGIKPSASITILLTSYEPDSLSGLRSLAVLGGFKVVTSEAGKSAVKEACPPGMPILLSRDFEAAADFPVRTLSLGGRGLEETACVAGWQGKRVLFTGRIPLKPSRSSEEALFVDKSKKQINPSRYLQSLDALSSIKPDLWLPLHPQHGQNANLYDDEWRDILKANERLISLTDEAP